MNIQRANFQDVLSFYFDSVTTNTAFQLLPQMIRKREHLQLASLLRNHRSRAVYSSRERYLRACVDDLLTCFGVLEICILTGFIEEPDESKFWETSQQILNNKQVQRYIAEFYPQALPLLMSRRLAHQYRRVEETSPKLTQCVLQFLALDQIFMNTLNNSYLLAMLDSFTIKGTRFRDVVSLIDEPKTFLKRILVPPEKRTIADIVLQELGEFIQFSLSLSRLLETISEVPLVQSMVWNHYGYWFQIIGLKMQQKLGAALDRFLTWNSWSPDDKAAVEVRTYVAEAKAAIEKLTSLGYAVPVQQVLQR